MLQVIKARLAQGQRTIAFPKAEPVLPDRFRGLPEINPRACEAVCQRCSEACPVDCIERTSAGGLCLDMGKCLFCGACERACPAGAVRFTQAYSLASRTRRGLELSGGQFEKAEALGRDLKKLFGRSLKLRQVSAGGCNGCEVDINVLGTPVFDLGRFGIQIVASPRHADALVVTGPVSENMRIGLLKTYEATPSPKLVIACGSCAISGGPFRDHPEVHNGVESLLPVDLFVPGCPPHPITLLDGLLRLLGRSR